MVCKRCTKKLAMLGAPSVKKKSRAPDVPGGKRKINENKLLSMKKKKFQPHMKFVKCKECKGTVHQAQAFYCQACAFKNGICAMCGKKMVAVKDSKQSSV